MPGFRFVINIFYNCGFDVSEQLIKFQCLATEFFKYYNIKCSRAEWFRDYPLQESARLIGDSFIFCYHSSGSERKYFAGCCIKEGRKQYARAKYKKKSPRPDKGGEIVKKVYESCRIFTGLKYFLTCEFSLPC